MTLRKRSLVSNYLCLRSVDYRVVTRSKENRARKEGLRSGRADGVVDFGPRLDARGFFLAKKNSRKSNLERLDLN